MFAEKLVIITGGSSGLGKALAERLLKKGAHLALIARERSKLEAVKEELLKSVLPGQKVEIFSCDVSDYPAVEKTFQVIVDRMGLPSLLINSAGILEESPFEKQSLESFHQIMNTNFYGTLHCIKAILPYFKKRGKGRIVNISSLAGLMGVFGYSAYCASKHALVGLTHTLRCELKPQKIKIHLVCPPEFNSPMVEKLEKYRSPENRALTHTAPVLQAGFVADEIIRGMQKGKYQIIPGSTTRILTFLDRLFPFLSRWIVDYQIRKASASDKCSEN